MKKQDAELIQRILDGDQIAFTAIVEKYQKGIHTLAWQKIGDFHIAQEITQDTFLKAYQKLGTLKNRKLFCGWLYVIATNMCNDWLRKKRLPIQSLESVDNKEVEQVAYTNYIEDQIDEEANESRRELVSNLLKKLPESERTVMSLHYLGEMTCESISEFLGVSQNTIKSRLSRARNRLRKEESMIRQNLSSFQLPTQFTENIMERILNSKPMTPSATKPLIPLAISAASSILVVLLIGIGIQHRYIVQNPYSLNSQSERMIEITEAKFVLDTPEKLSLQSQIGNSAVLSENSGIGQNREDSFFAASETDETVDSEPKEKWIQTTGLDGGVVPSLFASTQGDMYAGTLNNLYRLSDDGRTWELIKTRNAPSLNPNNKEIGWGPTVEKDDTLYLATDTTVLSTTDRGETWKTVGRHPVGLPIGFVSTEHTFYLCSPTRLFRSDDIGVSWKTQTLIGINQSDLKMQAIANVNNTVFVGTNKGLYRLNDKQWERIYITPDESIGEGIDIHSLAVAAEHLYAIRIVPAKRQMDRKIRFPQGISKEVVNFGWRLYDSKDKGDSWNLIGYKENTTKLNRVYFSSDLFGPRKHQYPLSVKGPNFKVKITASKGRVVVIDTEYQSYTMDINGHWGLDETMFNSSIDQVSPTPVMLNPNTIYCSNLYGIRRTTDGGKTWVRMNVGLTGTTIWELFSVNDSLYAYTPNGIITSTDSGESWRNVFLDAGDITLTLKKTGQQLFARTDRMLSLVLNAELIPDEIDIDLDNTENAQDSQHGAISILRILPRTVGKSLKRETPTLIPKKWPNFRTLPGNFAVSENTFYAESESKLYKWKKGDKAWHDTGLVDIGKRTESTDPYGIGESAGFKIGVSGNTVYVGKRDGHLMQSLDEGGTWKDVTANLPFYVSNYKRIVFAGQDVYVATAQGVVRSRGGIEWSKLTDNEGNSLVMNSISVNAANVYGESGGIIYQIDRDSEKWKQVTEKIPYQVSCFDVDGSTIYVGTYGSGMLRYSLDE